MSAKVKSISRGVIDTRNHKKHGIDVDLDELVSEISQVDPQEIPAPVDAKTSDLPKPMVLAPNRPVKGAHNSIIWSKEMDKPPAFLSIIRQIKGWKIREPRNNNPGCSHGSCCKIYLVYGN
jgi:hypothetical protein